MEKTKRFLCGFLLALTALWWLADTPTLAALPNFFAWRNVWMQYSGVLGMGVMSVAMLLAVRPVRFEGAFGGLDKMYRLHKWLGIAALALSVSHWLMAQGPKWLVGLGWLERGVRGPRGALPDGAIRQFLASQRGLAESIGEWAFYLAAALMVLALIKRFPYRHFIKVHHLLAVTYLVLVWHSVVLLKWESWGTLLGVCMAVLMAAGSVASVLVLLGRVARSRKVAGQFAFVTLHAKEGAHPYTISSAWASDGRLTFLIKALGDYTRTLAQQVAVGDSVQVEGPYGRFNFEGAKKRQIWVGGGIGITPFVARMKTLARLPDARSVDLFHTTAVYDPNVIALLERDAQDAGVRLHLLWDARDGRLDAERIARHVPDWKSADFWFCGPAPFGQALRSKLLAMGLDDGSFHQELFEMR